MIKVSVIVPVYKVELFVERCIRSLMEQTLQEVEFIIIDDCSPDNSLAIIKNVILRQKRSLNNLINVLTYI